MTRKTRTRRPRVHSIYQSGYCAVCHQPYVNLEEHIHSKRHLKLIGDDGEFISIKGFDSFLALDELDSIEVNAKNYDHSLPRRRTKMPKTRTSSVICDRMKDTPLSPIGGDTGHRLRSRKNINYVTPLEEDSLTEKPEVVREFRELRSSSRLLAKLADQMVESDEVWNSGRPKRSCNRQRISADERLVVDNKSYYKVEVLSTKLRSGIATLPHELKRPETPITENKDDDKLMVKFRKLRNSELTRLNNEAENFLFPKKDESSEEEDDEDGGRRSQVENSSISDGDDFGKRIKMEDDESMHSTGSESRGRKKRRTHAEAFIMDNQKYYKFETPGSRLRYQGSYLSPVPMKSKNNGDCLVKSEPPNSSRASCALKLNEYNFSFESVPKNEDWYRTFQRQDQGEEKYALLSDHNQWNPFLLPYQLDRVPPLDPQECVTQYNQIKKCLLEPPSASTSVTCSTPDPNASNSSTDAVFNQDEDSKTSAAEVSADEGRSLSKRLRRVEVPVAPTGSGKNPRKSPRQHASTLAILSSLIQQRKRKSRRADINFRSKMPTIVEEPKQAKSPKKSSAGELYELKSAEEEFTSLCEENMSDVEIENDEEIDFGGALSLEEMLNVTGSEKSVEVKTTKRVVSGRPGRKPGKRKKNRTGWPLNRSRRMRKEQLAKDDDDSTVDSISVNADSEENDLCEDANSTDSNRKKESVAKLNSDNNNCNDHNSISDVNTNTEETNCDLDNADRVGNDENKSDDINADKQTTNEIKNSEDYSTDLHYQPFVCVQKIDKNRSGHKNEPAKRSNSPKRTNRGQRRMPASPKSPRMLRRPRGRWYRER